MGLTESLNDYVTQSKNPALHPDHLHRCARLWGRCFWGEQYPDQEVLDDIENYRALELLHAGFIMRHRTWKILVDPGAGTDTTDSLWQELVATRDVSTIPSRLSCAAGQIANYGGGRNSPTSLSLPSSLARSRPDVHSTPYTWAFAHFTHRFSSIVDSCALTPRPRPFTDRLHWESSTLPVSSLPPIVDLCGGFTGLF